MRINGDMGAVLAGEIGEPTIHPSYEDLMTPTIQLFQARVTLISDTVSISEKLNRAGGLFAMAYRIHHAFWPVEIQERG